MVSVIDFNGSSWSHEHAATTLTLLTQYITCLCDLWSNLHCLLYKISVQTSKHTEGGGPKNKLINRIIFIITVVALHKLIIKMTQFCLV